jgi:type I restriction-modification system DNA methylase subunit
MNRATAEKLIKATFEKPFEEERYRYFVRELLNHLDESKALKQAEPYIDDAFKPHVRFLKRLGTYTDPAGEEIDILIVYLQKDTTLDRARTKQRDFVAHHLKKRDKEAALVAYASPDLQDWRFSFVRLEYQLQVDDATGKVRLDEALTPSRRYSFLVGANEPNHTAQQQLVSILADDAHDPSLDTLEEAFDIEVVTKQFFEDYKDRYLELVEAIDQLVANQPKVGAIFSEDKLTTPNFAKRLMGQIVFLYFLQKKGWLGVRDSQPGPKDFLRQLYGKPWKNYNNFFNEILEPLFYVGLAVEHPNSNFELLDCQIPFLNGGLFEPPQGYDWQNDLLPLPNAIFGRIFDTFDLYNFTVREDEPLEKEVAVDPEMLGKVFERLLEVQDRKSKGAFYTPREIVHYMCQESLINYLDTALNLRPDPLTKKDPVQDHMFAAPKQQQTAMTALKYDPIVPKVDLEFLVRMGEFAAEYEQAKQAGTKSYHDYISDTVREHAAEIDQVLADVKICDPAIGSGAFPVGMMHEIVRARQTLSTYLEEDVKKRTAYTFKRHAIQHSLYGVDIDPGAVDIAKLRLWLSLVVDEEDFTQVKPLPNLDYKIVVGNSLLSKDADVFTYQQFEELEILKRSFLSKNDNNEKAKLKTQIDKSIQKLLPNGQFSTSVFFSEILISGNGFDILVANPPYGIVFDPVLKDLLESRFPRFKRNNDIYVAFFEYGLGILLKNQGQLVYISPNTYLNGDYFKKLRAFLTGVAEINEIRDYKEVPVFDDPTVFVCIISLTKNSSIKYPYKVIYYKAKESITNFESSSFVVKTASDAPFKEENPILGRLSLGKYTVLEEIFHIKDVGFNYWTKGRGKSRAGKSIGKRILYSGSQKHSKDIPFIKGKNISRWSITEPNNYLKHDYPTYLDLEVDYFRFSENFLKINPKIVYRQTANTIIAAIDYSSYYTDKTVHLIVPKRNWGKYSPEIMLGLLNSSLFAYFYSYISQETKGRVFPQVKTTYTKKLPIPLKPNLEVLEKIQEMVLEISKYTLSTDQSKIIGSENRLNQFVYELYNLTPEEIALVENSVGNPTLPLKKAEKLKPSAKPKKQPKAPPKPKPAKLKTTKTFTPTDYGWYRCGSCGHLVPGFIKQDHIDKEHIGQDVTWTKSDQSIRKS